MAGQFPGQDAIERFAANEDRVNTFVNKSESYITTDGVQVESIPQLIGRARETIVNAEVSLAGAVEALQETTTGEIEALRRMISDAEKNLADAIEALQAYNRGEWQPNTVYRINDIVTSGGDFFLSLSTHTSGLDFSSDFAAGLWFPYLTAAKPATSTALGLVQPDGTTITVTPGGVISAAVTGILPIANGGTGNSEGLAASATKLATARTIRTNLASTATASFNGTANITPGVTGVLPVTNGGTGVTNISALGAALGLEAPKIVTFTASGVYTTTRDCLIRATIVDGGQGGGRGGREQEGSSYYLTSGIGGRGGDIRIVDFIATANTEITITVGAGGSGASSSTGNVASASGAAGGFSTVVYRGTTFRTYTALYGVAASPFPSNAQRSLAWTSYNQLAGLAGLRYRDGPITVAGVGGAAGGITTGNSNTMFGGDGGTAGRLVGLDIVHPTAGSGGAVTGDHGNGYGGGGGTGFGAGGGGGGVRMYGGVAAGAGGAGAPGIVILEIF